MTSFIVTRVSPNSYLNDPHHKYSAVSGDLPSTFTILEKPYILSWLCANVKMY